MTSAILTVVVLSISFVACLRERMRRPARSYCYEESHKGYCLLPKHHAGNHRWITDIYRLW